MDHDEFASGGDHEAKTPADPAMEHQLKLLAGERDKCLEREKAILRAAHRAMGASSSAQTNAQSSGKFTDHASFVCLYV